MTTQVTEILNQLDLNSAENLKKISAHSNQKQLVKALLELQEEKLLNQITLDSVASYIYPSIMSDALIILNYNYILNDENLSTVIAHNYPKGCANALVELNFKNLLTLENRNLISSHQNPVHAARAIIRLDQYRLLNTENRLAITLAANTSEIAGALLLLNENEILNDENRQAVVNHESPDELAYILSRLKIAQIYNSHTREIVIAFKDLRHLGKSIFKLQNSNILTEQNLAIIVKTNNPIMVANAILILNKYRIEIDECKAMILAHDSPENLAQALVVLWQSNIFTKDLSDVISTSPNPLPLATALANLNTAGILTREYHTIVLNHPEPKEISIILTELKMADILEDNLQIILNHPNYQSLFKALITLKNNEILTIENRKLIIEQQDPRIIAYAFEHLKHANIYTETNKKFILNHNDPISLALAYSKLSNAGVLSETYKTILAHKTVPNSLAEALCILHSSEVLITEEFLVTLSKHPNPEALAQILVYLDQAEITNREIYERIIQLEDLQTLRSCIFYFQRAGILNLECLNALLDTRHRALLTTIAYHRVWCRIPEHLLTQENLQRLFTASRTGNPFQVLEEITAQIINVVPRQVQNLNGTQSTHTASVHRCVSASAKKLMDYYGPKIDFINKIQEIEAYIKSLQPSFKNNAAQRCFQRITSPFYTFTDSSGISILQLLALAYDAIHDESKRLGSLDDAKALFIDGLYEIQRGYNLNEKGLDNQNPEDAYICSGGTFNKIIEKLNGIHSDVEVYFITHDVAYSKFPKIVENTVLKYLQAYTCPKTDVEYIKTRGIIENLKENGIDAIWDEIKAEIEEKVWSEFHEAYAENRNDQRFREMINYGNFSNVPDLISIEAQLLASPGYQAILYKLEKASLEEESLLLRLHQYSLWSNRHSSPEAQKMFDNRYGLAIIQ